MILNGHEHFYERIKPQNGIHLLVSGAAAKLRKKENGTSTFTAKKFADDHHVMLFEVDGAEMFYVAISLANTLADCGVIRRAGHPISTTASSWTGQCETALKSK